MKDFFIKVLNHQNNISKVKLIMFYSGFLNFFLLAVLFGPIVSTIIVVLNTLIKEVYKNYKIKKGSFNKFDFVFSVLPLLTYWILQLIN